MSFAYPRSADPRERGLRLRPRKCLHIYQYFLHPVFGFMNARLQTWFPFNMQICLNGREWLARQFERTGHTDFERADNCFPRLGDPALAQSPDVMRFLGRKGVHGNFTGEAVSSCKRRPEGVRVKHWVTGNSIKMYDKVARVLRVETTIGNPAAFTVLRPRQRSRRRPLAWQPLRKGVADLHRRATVSQQANARYLEALAAVENPTPLSQLFDRAGRRVRYRGRYVRALRIGDATDLALRQAISHGDFVTAGFRNRDLRRILHPSKRPATAVQARRQCARTSRHLRLLRAHGVIKKLSKTHRYQLTKRGRLLCAALFGAREAPLQKLVGSAAA